MAMISINKQTNNKKHLNAALLAAGTASHAWFDDDSASVQQMTKQAALSLLGKQRLHSEGKDA